MDINEIVSKITSEVVAQISASPCAAHQTSIAGMIEHSVMNPDVSRDKVVEACRDVKELGFANICVTPYYVPTAVENGDGIAVCTAIAFPHGAATTAAKVEEIREAIINGVRELDVSINILAIKSGDLDEAKRDLDAMIRASRGRAVIKAIFEQCMYSETEKIQVLEMAKEAGVDYIKISNALSGKKASAEDVRFVRGVLGSTIGIKIDGSISDEKTIRELAAAGACRFGCSRSVQIVNSLKTH